MQTSTTPTPTPTTINEWADFWRHQIGVNVIPADTQNKRPIIPWDQWQDNPIPEELHNQWKEQGIFSKGIAIIPGRVWHRPDKQGLYFTFLDADKSKAINELCIRNGKTTTLQEMSQKFIVEQHKDNLEKAHIYFYSPIPFPKKSADSVLGLEVKGLGEHGIAYCSSSIHQGGYPYEIIGATEPITLTEEQAKEFKLHVDTICRKHGIEYLDKHYRNLLDSDAKIYQGERHDSLISIANSILFRYGGNGKVEQELKNRFVDINNNRCDPTPLPASEINTIWKDAVAYSTKKKKQEEGSRTAGYYNNGELEGDERLAAENKLTPEDINFVINTIKKEAQYDELSIRQLFYGMGSAFTKDPISHIVNSKESGAGKSYLLNLVSSYFPNKYVIVLSGMSAKALFHRRGVLVIQNKETGELEPIAPIIEPLQSEKDDIENKVIDEMNKESKSRDKKQIKDWKRRIRELELEIKDIESRAEKLIQLDNQIIICLDTPEPSVYDSLMSIISQDTERDQQYSFVDKSGASGKLGTKDNILRGTPMLCTSQVIDDTKTLRFAEKNRRFININPDTSDKKIRAANNIIGLKYGTIPEEYDELVVSRADKERAKQIVNILIAKLKQHTKHLGPKEDGVKIPIALSITNSIPNNHVWSMTVTERTMKYLAIITKMNMDSRPKLIIEQTGQFFPISTFEDLKETLNLMQIGASGVRPYLVDWYNKGFIPIYNDLDGKPNQDTKEGVGKNKDEIIVLKEKRVGLTTKQLSEGTKQKMGGPKLSTKDLYDKYLLPLINQGIIDHIESEINKRDHIYFPVEEEGGNLFHIFDDDYNSKGLRLKVSDPDIFPSKSFLKEQFRILSKQSLHGSGDFEKNISCYRLMDADGSTEITLDQLIEKYFTNPEDCFVKNWNNAKDQSKDSTKEGSDNGNGNEKIFSEKVCPSTAIVLTEFSKSDIEEFFKDDPDTPWYMPSHDLDQSPCRHIIHKKGEFYSCKLHPKEANSIYLDAIEQHCKYKDPELHKAEILRLLEQITS